MHHFRWQYEKPPSVIAEEKRIADAIAWLLELALEGNDYYYHHQAACLADPAIAAALKKINGQQSFVEWAKDLFTSSD